MYDDALHAMIDDLIAHMNQSNDQLGLPPLDPLVLSNIDLNLANSFIEYVSPSNAPRCVSRPS